MGKPKHRNYQNSWCVFHISYHMIVGLKVPINHNVNIVEHHCHIKYEHELSINHHVNQFKQATHSDEHN
jgi:hypothetical protein